MNSDATHTDASVRRPAWIKRAGYALGGISVIATVLLFTLREPDSAATADIVPPATAAAALTVTSARPREVTWPVTLEAYGTIAPWEEASIGAQIGGYQLVDVLVNVGDPVKKGQVLARFDPALLLAEQAELQASADQAAANRDRARALQSSNAISKQDVLQAVTQSKVADAALAKNQLQVKYTEVLAPDDGVISARTATLGATIPLGQELFRMIRQGRQEWRGEVTATQLAQIESGQDVTLQLPDNTLASATIRQASPLFDQASRLATVYADIQPGSSARAGMYVAGKIQLGNTRALVVPAKSVVIRDGRSYVLTLSAQDDTPQVALQPIAVGRRYGQEVEITEGLDADRHVVVDGAGFLSDGDVVRVAPNAPAGGAAQL
ncbi:efflux RND transporter periplasmic adaptor subunit [Microbulbifer litoralis]|uniref:efflux RND transporter periplasmic adaptor subunit n=1 Tax=Microbulbifer litoralis TaxID=2933965 RepID=UPI00202836AA|nr:efflux RND transporter periplasmic adaptor subunit [Microbulbifer sp. GX H0434]